MKHQYAFSAKANIKYTDKMEQGKISDGGRGDDLVNSPLEVCIIH